MHWRRIPISSIPVPPASTSSSPPDQDDKKSAENFSKWLENEWRIKDELIEGYLQNGSFPNVEETVETEVKLGSVLEIGHIFLPLLLALGLSAVGVAVYNTLRYGTIWGLG